VSTATATDTVIRCMGCDVRLLVGDARAADDAVAFLRDFDARLSRFAPDSELSALNADPRATVPASPLLRAAVGAGLWAAQQTAGLVDPTLTAALERAGYAGDFDVSARLALADALAAAPPRRPARAAPGAAWRAIEIDDAAGTISRPPGVRIDTGGIGKGLAADAVAHRLTAAGRTRFAIDCGGDLYVNAGDGDPYRIDVVHPLTGAVAQVLQVARGGVATSGLDRRVWRGPDGRPRHHLLDPSTGEPAWTGLLSVTALAPTALEAETRAKHALMRGPAGARDVLAAGGGVLVADDGTVDAVLRA
jgi:thiamine biosynthesis lipoprotein